MMLPEIIEGRLPTVCYQHATTDGRSDVPSNLEGGYELGVIFASLGMVVSAADYIGMGESRGFHPYIHADLEASAAVDMMFAVRQYLQYNNIEQDDELFVTGYSQGGHAAMAAHRLLQEEYSADFPVTASLPMSGPYDVSGVMKALAVEETEYFSPSFIVNTVLGARAVNPDAFESIDEVFRQEFLGAIGLFEETGDGLRDLNLRLLTILEENFGASVPRFMFKDSILALVDTDPDHFFNTYLRENDLYDWIPEAPVRMLYCPDDEQVPFVNSTFTDSVMNMAGAQDVESVDVSGGLIFNHLGCVVPALNDGIPWLLSFLDETVAVDEAGESKGFFVFPNPVSDELFIDSGDLKFDKFVVHSLDGRRVIITDADPSRSLRLDGLQPGVYFLRAMSDQQVYSFKFVKI